MARRLTALKVLVLVGQGKWATAGDTLLDKDFCGPYYTAVRA